MGNHPVWADSPLFSLLRNRLPARRRLQRRRRYRTSARVSWASSVICSAESTTRRENHKHARNSPTKCRFGRAASVMYPAAAFILAARKPMAAQSLGDIAVAADSPLLPPCRHRPLVRTSVASAKRLSDALRRQRRRCGAHRLTSSSRQHKPTPAHQVREVATFPVLPLLFSRRS